MREPGEPAAATAARRSASESDPLPRAPSATPAGRRRSGRSRRRRRGPRRARRSGGPPRCYQEEPKRVLGRIGAEDRRDSVCDRDGAEEGRERHGRRNLAPPEARRPDEPKERTKAPPAMPPIATTRRPRSSQSKEERFRYSRRKVSGTRRLGRNAERREP
jgi:hypothetical protein